MQDTYPYKKILFRIFILISILFCLYPAEVSFEILITEVRIKCLNHVQEIFIEKHYDLYSVGFLSKIESLSPLIYKDSTFEARKDPQSSRHTTTRKRWGSSPPFKVIFLVISVGLILNFEIHPKYNLWVFKDSP